MPTWLYHQDFAKFSLNRHYNETLTGFKWMANKAFDCINQGMRFIFAFEEAIGYMCGSTVLDKDGIRAALQMTQMAVFIYSHGGILCDLLRDTYLKYGYHVSCNSYFICHDPAAITSMFDKLRNFNGVPNEYPKFLEGDTPFPIVGVRDLTTGFDSLQPDQKALQCKPVRHCLDVLEELEPLAMYQEDPPL
ncbi:phosphoglucomutase-2 [Trichonephila clavipes]|nr:phosphoglucomutase-2 [Trichonephila clavipes]